MRTPTPTTVDQITAEKMKISERLARLDAAREKIATQLADLETAERVLTRVSKAPPGRRPRSAPVAEAKAAITPRGRGRPPRAATAKSAGRERSAQNLGLRERVLALATGKTRQELYSACPSDIPRDKAERIRDAVLILENHTAAHLASLLRSEAPSSGSERHS